MATAIKQYPVQYQDIARAGFNWQRMRGNDAKEIILWRHEQSNEFLVTVRSHDGRVQRFVPEGDGTLTVVKPEPLPVIDDDEMEPDGLRVVAVAEPFMDPHYQYLADASLDARAKPRPFESTEAGRNRFADMCAGEYSRVMAGEKE